MRDFLGKGISTRENSWGRGPKMAKCPVCLNNSSGGSGVAGAGGQGREGGVVGSRGGESDHQGAGK